MFTIWLKYYLLCSLLLCILFLKAQEPNDNSQAIISIIGNDPAEIINTHDFINTNPYYQPVDPPEKTRKIQQNQNIEPTLENGFHMRFEVSYSEPIEQMGMTSFSSADDNDRSKRREVSFTQRKFNIKKRIHKWLPVRKKKYQPTNCGRF